MLKDKRKSPRWELRRYRWGLISLAGVQEILTTFLMAASPILECRGAIPYGVLVGVDPTTVFLVSFLGNILPVPFLLLFLNRFEHWVMGMGEGNWLRRIYTRYIERLRKRAKPTIDRYGMLGLAAFVAVPLPLTGAWTASLLSSLLGMEAKRSLGVIVIGALVACIIVMALMLAYGFIFP
jgi:uncharacterized membrane protein